MNLVFQPLTLENWKDIEKLFGEDSICRSCWCMWWRQSSSEWQKRRGIDRKESLKTIVSQGKIPGILVYSDEQPIGWCSVSPREEFHKLERSRTLKRIDSQPVWSVVCFFVAKPFRGKGISTKLLEAAVSHARKQGAKVIEGYPSRSMEKQQDTVVYTGLASMFLKVGFVDCGSNSKRALVSLFALSVNDFFHSAFRLQRLKTECFFGSSNSQLPQCLGILR